MNCNDRWEHRTRQTLRWLVLPRAQDWPRDEHRGVEVSPAARSELPPSSLPPPLRTPGSRYALKHAPAYPDTRDTRTRRA